MSLPNPNIEFVPLDKLTASQLNQLVANIVALANGSGLDNKSVNGDKLANSAVKPEHLSDDITKLSTTERVVGKWIDGKSIYEKVITFSNFHEININTNFETIVEMECIIKSNEGQWRNLPWLYGQDGYVDSSWHGGFYLRPDRKIVFQTGSNISKIVYGHLILRYTKN